MAASPLPTVLVIDSSSRATTLMDALGVACRVRHVESLASARVELSRDDPGCAIAIASKLSDGDGFEALRLARSKHPDTPRLMLLDRADGPQLNEACALGAFVACEPLGPELLRSFIEPAIASHARGIEHLEMLMTRIDPKLSPREREILMESVCGFTQKEISANRGIELETVKTYVKRILRKTHTTSLDELTRPLVRALVRPNRPR